MDFYVHIYTYIRCQRIDDVTGDGRGRTRSHDLHVAHVYVYVYIR